MSYCYVCKSKAKNTEGVSIHKWPASPKSQNDKLEKWKRFAGLQPDIEPPKSSGICSRHFKPKCFHRVRHFEVQQRRLIQGSVPTEFGSTTRQVSQQATCYVECNSSPTSEPGTCKMSAERDQERITKQPVSTAKNVSAKKVKISVEESSKPNERPNFVFSSGKYSKPWDRDDIGKEEKDKVLFLKLTENHVVPFKRCFPKECDGNAQSYDPSNTYGLQKTQTSGSIFSNSNGNKRYHEELKDPFDEGILESLDSIKSDVSLPEIHSQSSQLGLSDPGLNTVSLPGIHSQCSQLGLSDPGLNTVSLPGIHSQSSQLGLSDPGMNKEKCLAQIII